MEYHHSGCGVLWGPGFCGSVTGNILPLNLDRDDLKRQFRFLLRNVLQVSKKIRAEKSQ
jgi:hypothetical protein